MVFINQNGPNVPYVCKELSYAIRYSQDGDISIYGSPDGVLALMVLDRAVRDLFRPESEKFYLKPYQYRRMIRGAYLFFSQPHADTDVYNLSTICEVLGVDLETFLYHIMSQLYVVRIGKDLPSLYDYLWN